MGVGLDDVVVDVAWGRRRDVGGVVDVGVVDVAWA